MSFSPGEVFAGYTIVRRLGVGGMGEVYLAQHPRLPRHDAIKVLPPHLAADESFRQRFLREADLAATLNHPNIVGVLDRGEEDGRLWLSMPYINGIDAAARLAQSPGGLPYDTVVAIVRDTAAALDFAHQRSILHRDVKPANIMLDTSRALLSDFGIARAADDTSDLTATGTTIGSVAYAAPEQLRGDEVDSRADVYSLAATAYALLTGSRPFDRSSPAAVIAAALDGAVVPVTTRRPDIPPSVDRTIARGMAASPADRPQSAGEFAAELAQAPAEATVIRAVPPTSGAHDAPTMIAPTPLPSPRPEQHRRLRWRLPTAVAAALVVGAVVAGTAVMLSRSDSVGTSASPAIESSTVPSMSSSTVRAAPPTAPAIAPATTVAPASSAPPRGSGDLGLTRPVSRPPCDGRFILVLGSIEQSNPAVRTLVNDQLSTNPGAEYFYSGALNCGSIRSADDNGEAFYTPYVDYGTSSVAACNGLQHRGVYVRVLRNGTGTGEAANPCK
ncbi:serine/threonine-protein kinase [Tsukamurella spumae]|uniref:non-specific serine/threonine protein kinase n=1 Tax=Tsukamurella spumae TaxID=44753 RepID=A0A846X767_9ACTN|nr:serine/threonine-protein kinase [Tsukamurella spumae]NKY20042.1 serine/threonine protein kinase [Tsukamurella spumae]